MLTFTNPDMPVQGLNDEMIMNLRMHYGKNVFRINQQKRFLKIAWGIVKEPMFLLLLAASILYLLLRQSTEFFMMIAALFFVAAISLFQEIKSSNALAALQQLTDPKVRVIRYVCNQLFRVSTLSCYSVFICELV